MIGGVSFQAYIQVNGRPVRTIHVAYEKDQDFVAVNLPPTPYLLGREYTIAHPTAHEWAEGAKFPFPGGTVEQCLMEALRALQRQEP